MSAQPIVQVEDLDVYYGTSQILFGVGLSVRQGETMALLGRNGAGKSTLLKTVIGIAPPGAGSIRVAGENTAGFASAEIARRGVGYVPQGRGLFAGMTVLENLLVAQHNALMRASGFSLIGALGLSSYTNAERDVIDLQ